MKLTQFDELMWHNGERIVFHYNSGIHLLTDLYSEDITEYEVSPRVFETVREFVQLYDVTNIRLAVVSAVVLHHARIDDKSCACGEKFDLPAAEDLHALHQASAVLWALRPNRNQEVSA